MPRGVALDCPDWLLPRLTAALARIATRAARDAPPRAGLSAGEYRQTSRGAGQGQPCARGIETRTSPLADTALQVVTNARRVRQSPAFTTGLVELQDAASQAVIAALPDLSGATVLDYCAGGGGKALAMAARGAQVTAHDADAGRMRDLPDRAARAGARIALAPQPKGLFDLVLTDVPCSGSGAWRRAPEGKWALTRPAGTAWRIATAIFLQRHGRMCARAGIWPTPPALCSMRRIPARSVGPLCKRPKVPALLRPVTA